jgi:hypothetical protein
VLAAVTRSGTARKREGIRAMRDAGVPLEVTWIARPTSTQHPDRVAARIERFGGAAVG